MGSMNVLFVVVRTYPYTVSMIAVMRDMKLSYRVIYINILILSQQYRVCTNNLGERKGVVMVF